MSNNIIQINKHLEEFTKCYICLGKLCDATMCPNCQKLSCQKCIQKWIIERKSQCPHCRMSLKLNQIISVRFINELNTVIETLNLTKQKAKQEICQAHNITLLYFCLTCNESLCSDCFMFEAKHKDHKIEKLENIYNSHCLLIKNESKELKNKCDKLNNYLKLLNEKIIFVRNYKTERSIELEEVFEKMKNKLESLMHEKLTKLINSKNLIIDKLKFLDNIKSMIDCELTEAPKSELISKSENIIKDLKEIEKEDEMKNDVLNISLDLPSDIHPPYESGCFVIKDYKVMVMQFQSNMQMQQLGNLNSACANNVNVNCISNNLNGFGSSINDVLYSEDLKTNGLIWRLKVYPFGNGAIKGEFVSVFLELRDGLVESSKYFYKIEIENFYKDSSNALTQSSSMPNYIGKRTNFWKEFSSDFQNGECWGYNKFYRIEDLEKDGFIDETGKLVFRFYLRPQTYAQLCRDQKNYIKSLEKNNQLLSNQVNNLNKNSSASNNNNINNNNNFNKENFSSENFVNNFKKDFDKNKSPNLKQFEDKVDNDDSNKMQISDVNSPVINNNLHNNGQAKINNSHINNNNYNLIKIENDYADNNYNYDDADFKSENISPVITANNLKDKMDLDTEETNNDNSNKILNTQIRLKKSQSVIVSNNTANTSKINNNNNILNNQIIEDLNKNNQNSFVLNKNQKEDLNAENNENNMQEDDFILEENRKKEQKINAINTLTVNCDYVDEINFHNNLNQNHNYNLNNNSSNGNKFSILNHICENKTNKGNNANQILKQEDLISNFKREKTINFPLTANIANFKNNNQNYNSSIIETNINKVNNSNEINEIGNLNTINNDKNVKDKIINAFNNLNNNHNSNNNRYSKISNINTINVNSNFASLNFNYKNNDNNNQSQDLAPNNIININNNNINTSNSTNNFIKGKVLKNSISITNNNNNILHNTNNSSENFNKQISENHLTKQNTLATNTETTTNTNLATLINQNNKLNNLQASAENIGNLSNRHEISNTSRNQKNLNNQKLQNFRNMEISTEMKDDIRDEEPNFFLNYSEIKISKGFEDKQEQQNANNLILQLKCENAEVESEPIIITEINYKDLNNKKVKNKLLKCERLLSEIKVKDESVKISNNNNNNNINNKTNLVNNNASLISRIKLNNNNGLISNANKANLNCSNNFNNNNNNSNSGLKAKNSIQILEEQQQSIEVEKELLFNPLEINERNSNINKNLVLDISENLSQENNLNDSLGSLMESMKMMDDNSFYDQHVLNLQKIKRAKDIFEDSANNKYKAVKDFKSKYYKEDKSNRENNTDNFNLYPENKIFNNRHPSPFLSNNNNNLNSLINSNNKRNADRNNIKEPLISETFNEKLKKLISKKKK